MSRVRPRILVRDLLDDDEVLHVILFGVDHVATESVQRSPFLICTQKTVSDFGNIKHEKGNEG